MEKEFKKLCEDIRLTPNQSEDAKTKYTNVCITLHNEYYESDYDGKTKFLFGSYKTKTNTRPLTEMQDVDVLFKIPQEIFDKFDEYAGNGQAALLQEIKDISEIKINHRLAAEAYKEIRDSYLLLIEEIASNDGDLSMFRNKSKEYQQQYSSIGKYSPTTSYEDYQEAQKGLGLKGSADEEFTWSNNEIDKFLPEKLRKANLN